MLQTPKPSIEAVLTSLINDVSAIPDEIVLVLDDYHVIESPQVDDALTFLISPLPEDPIPGLFRQPASGY